jgi:hypothetical protein
MYGDLARRQECAGTGAITALRRARASDAQWESVTAERTGAPREPMSARHDPHMFPERIAGTVSRRPADEDSHHLGEPTERRLGIARPPGLTVWMNGLVGRHGRRHPGFAPREVAPASAATWRRARG